MASEISLREYQMKTIALVLLLKHIFLAFIQWVCTGVRS